MKKTVAIISLAALSIIPACAKPSGQSQYMHNEVGVSTIVQFATVLDVRPIDITGQNSGGGALAGGALGATAGSSAGNGSGQLAAMIGGAVIGAVAGHAAEQGLANSKGYEYTLITEAGTPMTVAQNHNEGDKVLQKGERVIVQTSGSYQRVLPASHLPTEVNRPKGIKVVD